MILGIDRASVDGGTVDWQKAKAAGCSFAFLRACYGAQPDKAFAAEWPKLVAAGITGGAYLFWRVDKDPATQAEEFVTYWKEVVYNAANYPNRADVWGSEVWSKASIFPPVVDVEFPGDGGLASTGISPAEALERLSEVVDVIQDRLRVVPMIYTSARVWHEDLKDTEIDAKLPLWLVRYPYKPGPWRPAPQTGAPPVPAAWKTDADDFWIWQYQGDATGFPGFSRTVDMNRFNALARGAKGARVTWLQKKLLAARARQEPAVVTGPVFDQATEDQVRRYQASAGLVSDGVVGPRSFARLCWEGGL